MIWKLDIYISQQFSLHPILIKKQKICKQILKIKFDKNIVSWQWFLIIMYNKITTKAIIN